MPQEAGILRVATGLWLPQARTPITGQLAAWGGLGRWKPPHRHEVSALGEGEARPHHGMNMSVGNLEEVSLI